MKLQDLFQETITALNSNKVRSGLTILGIVIGIGSMITVISIGQGASKEIQSSIEKLGPNLLTVRPGFSHPDRETTSSSRRPMETLKKEDADIIKQIAGVAYVSPEQERWHSVTTTSGKSIDSAVIGVSPEYAIVYNNISVAKGSFITEANLRSMSRVAVLKPTAAADLFGKDINPIDKIIRIDQFSFKVIGVLQQEDNTEFNFNPLQIIYVPLTTMQKILTGEDNLSSITISVKSKNLIAQVQQKATLALIDKHHANPQNPDFSIVSQADILKTFTDVTKTVTIFLSAITGISLIVGGIGIMNMMLTTVTERTREIGLKKAIGAKNKDICFQFLVEATMLTSIGGAIGIVLGWLISLLISTLGDIEISVSIFSIFLAFGICAAIGISFGYWPAQKAAKLNPIEALRYE